MMGKDFLNFNFAKDKRSLGAVCQRQKREKHNEKRGSRDHSKNLTKKENFQVQALLGRNLKIQKVGERTSLRRFTAEKRK